MYPATNMYHNWIYLYPRIYMGGGGGRGGGCDINHYVRFAPSDLAKLKMGEKMLLIHN